MKKQISINEFVRLLESATITTSAEIIGPLDNDGTRIGGAAETVLQGDGFAVSFEEDFSFPAEDPSDVTVTPSESWDWFIFSSGPDFDVVDGEGEPLGKDALLALVDKHTAIQAQPISL